MFKTYVESHGGWASTGTADSIQEACDALKCYVNNAWNAKIATPEGYELYLKGSTRQSIRVDGDLDKR